MKITEPIFITFKSRFIKRFKGDVTHRVWGYQSDVEDYAINVLNISNRDYFLSHTAKGFSADVKVQHLKTATKFIVKA